MGKIEGLIYGYATAFVIALSAMSPIYVAVVRWLAPYLGVPFQIVVGIFSLIADIGMIWGLILVALIIGVSVRRIGGSIAMAIVVYVLLTVTLIGSLVFGIVIPGRFEGIFGNEMPALPPELDLTQIFQLPIVGNIVQMIASSGGTGMDPSSIIPIVVMGIIQPIVINLVIFVICAAVFAYIFSKILPTKKKEKKKGEKDELLFAVIFLVLAMNISLPVSLPVVSRTTEFPKISGIQINLPWQSGNEYMEMLRIEVVKDGGVIIAAMGSDSSLNVSLPNDQSVVFMYSIKGDREQIWPLMSMLFGGDGDGGGGEMFSFLPSAGVVAMFQNVSASEAYSLASNIQSQLASLGINVVVTIVLPIENNTIAFMREASAGEIESKFGGLIDGVINKHGGVLKFAKSLNYSDSDARILVTGIVPFGNGTLSKITGVAFTRPMYVKGVGTHIISTANFTSSAIEFASTPSMSEVFIKVPDGASITGWYPNGSSPYPEYQFSNITNNQTWHVENASITSEANFTVEYLFAHPLDATITKEVIGNVAYNSNVTVRITIRNNDATYTMENITIYDRLGILFGKDNETFFRSSLLPGENVTFEYAIPINFVGYAYLRKANVSYSFVNGTDIYNYTVFSNAYHLDVPLLNVFEIANLYVPGGILTIVGLGGLIAFLDIYFRIIKPRKARTESTTTTGADVKTL